MSEFFMKRDYRTTLSDTVPATSVGEIEIPLDTTPDTDAGWILIEPGVVGKEEYAFFHRSFGTSVYVYGVNRSNPVEHASGSSAFLANAIDYMNYLLNRANHQGYVYKKSNQHVVVKGGRYYVGSVTYDIPDLDTSDALPGKTLTVGEMNYVYVEDGDYSIRLEDDPLLYPVAKIVVNLS